MIVTNIGVETKSDVMFVIILLIYLLTNINLTLIFVRFVLKNLMEHTHSAMIVCSSSQKSVITMMENMNYVMSVGKKITNVNRPYAEDIFSNNEYIFCVRSVDVRNLFPNTHYIIHVLHHSNN